MVVLRAKEIENDKIVYISDFSDHKKTRFTSDIRLARKFVDEKFAKLWFIGHYGNDIEMNNYSDYYLMSISREERLA